MTDVPETTMVETRRVSCDGSGSIRPGAGYKASALGHPRVFLEIDERGYVECGYCDRRFVLKGSPAEHGIHELSAGDLPGPGDASVA